MQFDEVYKCYKQSKEKQVMLGDTVLAKLKNLASSLKTKESCDKLIRKFLEFMRQGTCKREGDVFLVVTVDDLDLNMESGYRILENLYRYLNNPQVIVLIAVDHMQIRLISDKHFIEALHVKGAEDKSMYVDQAVHLSGDFLMKVLPLSNRVYMPDKKNILKRAMLVEVDRSSPLKQFILGKIAEKMGIYYDAVGLKWHFCVPQTLRELIQYNDFLKTLYDIEDAECSEEERIRLYEVNHERFDRNISENMAIKILNSKQQRIFGLILDRNIERRAGYAINFLNAMRKDAAQEDKQQKLPDSVDDQNYCYSDLLEAIYALGRENYDEKPLVHCVLASFTSEMTKEYYNYVNNPSKSAQDEAAGRLESFLGNTFGGNWFGNMGPRVVADKNMEVSPIILRYVGQGDIDKFKYDLEMSNDQEMNQIENISDFIPMLESVFALFPYYYDANGNRTEPVWRMIFNGGYGENDNTCSIEVRVLNEKADFDIWGFVGKEIIIESKCKLQRQTDKIVDSLLSCIIHYYEKKEKTVTEEQKNIWREHLLGKSIWSKGTERKIHFPFYNLDLAYNVMKRVRRKMGQVETIDKNEILTYLQKVYGYIVYELQREDQFYQKVENLIDKKMHGDGKKQMASHFVNDFVSHPFIKAIGYRYRDQETGNIISDDGYINQERFNDLLYTMLNEFYKDDFQDRFSAAEVK